MLVLFAAMLPAGQAAAQAAEADVVDRVVAMVGDSAVLQSQVLEEVEFRRSRGTTLPQPGTAAYDALLSQVLDELVNRVLVLQAAARDTLVQVDDEQVEEIVNEELDRRAESVGGQVAFQQALQREGLTLASYREILRSQVRQSQVQQLYVQRALQGADPVDVSEDELLEAFQQARSQLQQRPRTLTFEQVVLAPTPSEAAKEAARAEAERLLDSIRAGADFADLARSYSDDPGTAENGGDLDWFRRGQMIREFEDAAFALADGQVSDVVETEFGYHIIKVERSRPGERRGRHILIVPEMGEEDVQRLRARADSVVELAGSGESMADLFDRYSDPLAPDTLTVTFEQLDQLPPGYSVLRTASQGQVVGPLEYVTARNETRLAVVRVREIREAGAYTYEEVKPQLAQQLQRTRLLERMIDRLKARTHIEIRM
jgi:peptidyl-prolyl cis-trans isomerase SurA